MRHSSNLINKGASVTKLLLLASLFTFSAFASANETTALEIKINDPSFLPVVEEVLVSKGVAYEIVNDFKGDQRMQLHVEHEKKGLVSQCIVAIDYEARGITGWDRRSATSLLSGKKKCEKALRKAVAFFL